MPTTSPSSSRASAAGVSPAWEHVVCPNAKHTAPCADANPNLSLAAKLEPTIIYTLSKKEADEIGSVLKVCVRSHDASFVTFCGGFHPHC